MLTIVWKSKAWKDLILIQVPVFLISFVSGGCRISSFSAAPLYPVSFIAQIRWVRGAGSRPKQRLLNKPSCLTSTLWSMALQPCVLFACLLFNHNYPVLEMFLGSSIHMEWWLCSQSAAQKEISGEKTWVKSSRGEGWRVERERGIRCCSSTRTTTGHWTGQENQISWTRWVGVFDAC